MLKKPSTPKGKQLSKGQRKHARRLKQEARKSSVPENKVPKAAPVAAPPAA